MPKPCSLCDSPLSRELTRRLKAGETHEMLVLWLASKGIDVHRTTIGRHAQHVLPDAAPRRTGPRETSSDLLVLVRDRVVEDVEDGRLSPTVTHGLQAQAQLDQRSARVQDRQLMARIALALTGNIPVQARIVDPEMDAIEAEFRALLPGADEYVAAAIPPRVDPRER